MTTILTLELDPASQSHFEALRRQHYPAHLNQIPAHITLFHQLPPLEQIAACLDGAAQRPSFELRVTGLRSLGRGVAFTLASADLMQLHRELAETFVDHLTAQDRQPFKPHIVVQNKVTPELGRQTLAALQTDFLPFTATAVGLTLWNYLGGPWEQAASFGFEDQPKNYC